MANIIDHTYFIRDLLIGQPDQTTVQAALVSFIDKYEQKYLLKLFGYNFKKAYDAGITANAQIYKDIRDGKEYTNRYGVLDKWRGLADTTAKTSPIANYCYYWYERNGISKTLGEGEFIFKPENKTAVSPAVKMARAWNEMVCWNKEFWEFMYCMQDVYPIYFEDIRNYSMKYSDLYKPVYEI